MRSDPGTDNNPNHPAEYAVQAGRAQDQAGNDARAGGRCLDRLFVDQLDLALAAMCKLHCTRATGEIVDECFQVHGGYGFMEEYAIAKLCGDVRAQKIYGIASEVMTLLIACSLAQ